MKSIEQQKKSSFNICKKMVGLFWAIVFAAMFSRTAASQGHVEILPYIAAESEELRDFAYSLFTIKNAASGKATSLDMDLERNLIFLSGKQVIMDGRVLLDRFPELGIETKTEISKIPVKSEKCLIQPFGSDIQKYSVIIISSYKEESESNDFKCLVLGTSFLFGLQENIIDDDLSIMIKALIGGI